MAEDPLHDIIEAVRARLKAEVETQLQTVSERHQQELAEARAARQDAEQALATERHLAQARLEEERRSAAEQLEKLEQTLQALEIQRVPGDTAGLPTERPASRGSARLLDRFREIDAAGSVSETVAGIARAAAAEAPPSILFLANGSQLQPWSSGGATATEAQAIDTPAPELAGRALRLGEVVREEHSCAVPLMLDGVPIGVLHAHADGEGATEWAGALEVLARHGAARLGYLTALRTAQARHWLSDSSATRSSPAARIEQEDDAASARRYARLVISEIKLYNESAVEEGRSRRDLLARLGPEIERARQVYEERVPASVTARSEYFQQELVQTLAGGDLSLLG